MDEETRRINRLLSGGKLSGPEADEIIENVLGQLAREKRAKVRPIRYWAGAALAAAAAVMLVVFLPRTPGGGIHDPEEGDFTPDALSVTCVPGTLAACPLSSSLVFTLSPAKHASGYLSAYAEPVGHDAPRVFYFSKEDGSVELASPANPERAAQRTVRLSASQKPGRYRVRAVLADRPLTHGELVEGAEARDDGVRLRTAVEIVIVD